jgi:hypothetical protein
MAVLPKRFGKYGLTLHPEKTRLIEFRRPDRRAPLVRAGTPCGPGTFDLLGFTHYWGKSRLGKWTVRRLTAKDRFRRALRRIADWCRAHLHDDLRAQQQALVQKLNGHYGYFGITGNSKALWRFLYEVTRAWRKWLGRRSQRARVDWARMSMLLKRHPLPQPRIVRSSMPRVANP